MVSNPDSFEALSGHGLRAGYGDHTILIAGLIPIAGGILVPFMGVGIFGWLPMLAGLAMAMSSVTVVGNSILLGRYKPSFAKKKSKREELYTDKDLKKVYSVQTARSRQ